MRNRIEDCTKKNRLQKAACRLPHVMRPLFNNTSMSNVLYDRSRCESVQSATVRIDADRCLSEVKIYWKRIYPVWQWADVGARRVPGGLFAQVPEDLYPRGRAHLLAKERPHAIYYHGSRASCPRLTC